MSKDLIKESIGFSNPIPEKKGRCDHVGCNEVATTKGHVYGHIRDIKGPDRLWPVNACDKHKQEEGFFRE